LPDKIRLLGLVMQADDRKALIEIPPQPAAWFKVGDQIAEWTVTAIEENHVLFSHRSSVSATLALYSDSTAK
jgi:2-keto-3-deoxy-galactonokinase